jgi:hypothetical protein
LPDQLVHPLLDERPGPVGVDVGSVCATQRLPIDGDPEADGMLAIVRTHDEVHVAGVEAERDAAVRLVEGGSVPPHGPVAGKRPVVASQHLGALVLPRDVRRHAARGGEVLRLTVSEVGLRGLQAVPVRLNLGTARVDRCEVLSNIVGSGIGQKLPDDYL